MGLEFSQKWIADAAAELLGKPVGEISAEDMKKIRYLSIGESFENDYFHINLSLDEPPKPFFDFDGGDEWLLCLRGEDISKLAEKFKGKGSVMLSMFGLYHEDAEWLKLSRSSEVRAKCNKFTRSTKKVSYYEENNNDDEFEEWYDGIRENAWRDITLFSGVEVLRIHGLTLPDLAFLDKLPDLRVLELVETEFVSTEGIEKLTRLEQLACWLD